MPTRFEFTRHPSMVSFNGKFRIKGVPTAPQKNLPEETLKRSLQTSIEQLRRLQSRLLASDQRSLLVVFQAMDAAGKDGTIRSVMSGINPAGCEVSSFKKPSESELDHDFLWRISQKLPERGRIGIFNRSHYEEVLVVRVHPEYLVPQRLPNMPKLKDLMAERYESIRDFEKHIARSGTRIVKFWLNVSKAEQKKRFLERIEDPEANWKFKAQDIIERGHWNQYMAAYEQALAETSRPWAPWYAIAADDKHHMRAEVASILVKTLQSMKLEYPKPDPKEAAAMKEARAILEKRK